MDSHRGSVAIRTMMHNDPPAIDLQQKLAENRGALGRFRNQIAQGDEAMNSRSDPEFTLPSVLSTD